jgi:TetR/AcrR family transcriptional regulator, upper aerobic nicotinate degradation pathway regulator
MPRRASPAAAVLDPPMPLARDPVQTQRRILRAARNEFMRHGYSGARVERISRAARSSDRMIYYYFASKEALYLAVLESVYSELGDAESALVLDASRPREALDALIDFTWRYYLAHPEFVALLSNENLQRGRHITKSVKVKLLSRPVLDILGTILAEGERQGVFRRDLMQPAACDAWLEEIRRVMAAAVGAPEQVAPTTTQKRSR